MRNNDVWEIITYKNTDVLEIIYKNSDALEIIMHEKTILCQK